MLFYRAALPLSRQTLTYVAGVIRRHRARIGSCWRKLSSGRQALLVLAYLRNGETFADLAAGFEVSAATAWRYVTETIALLAARAPKLPAALQAARKARHAFVVLDGTLIPVDRLAADRPSYSGKHRKHGMNLQVIASPEGEIWWVSGPLPGSAHDLTAARIWGIIRELASSGLIVLADKGYHGAGEPLLTPVPGKEQAGLAEIRQPLPCPAARSRRASQRPAQDLAHPAQAPLLPLARRATGQGHPRPSGPRDRRMKRLSDRARRKAAEQATRRPLFGSGSGGPARRGPDLHVPPTRHGARSIRSRSASCGRSPATRSTPTWSGCARSKGWSSARDRRPMPDRTPGHEET